MGNHIELGSIVLLDVVKSELNKGDDNLTEWLSNLTIRQLVDHRDPKILGKYGEILQNIQDDLRYKPAALNEWARESIADAWLIATAAVYNFTIITFERHNNGLSVKNPSKKAQIPDIADIFGVRTQNLYYMMRTLGILLSNELR